jgi:hypothetical protein
VNSIKEKFQFIRTMPGEAAAAADAKIIRPPLNASASTSIFLSDHQNTYDSKSPMLNNN